jgi:hypothetical protein
VYNVDAMGDYSDTATLMNCEMSNKRQANRFPNCVFPIAAITAMMMQSTNALMGLKATLPRIFTPFPFGKPISH